MCLLSTIVLVQHVIFSPTSFRINLLTVVEDCGGGRFQDALTCPLTSGGQSFGGSSCELQFTGKML